MDIQDSPAHRPECATALRWRAGRHVGRTIYAQAGPDPSDDDALIGVMDTPRLAAAAVDAHNHLITTVAGALTAAQQCTEGG